MKVRELMTPSPVAIEPETPLKDVAAILVEHGISGRLERRSDTELLPRVVARVPGVVSVHSTLRWRWDDRKARPEVFAARPEPRTASLGRCRTWWLRAQTRKSPRRRTRRSRHFTWPTPCTLG